MNIKEEFKYIDEYFTNISKEQLFNDLKECGLKTMNITPNNITNLKSNEESIENKIEECLIEAHNLYICLNKQHNSDIDEWVNAMHDLQKLMMIRKTRRDYPDRYYTLVGN